MPSFTRKFNGKVYKSTGAAFTVKSQANESAKGARRMGNRARVLRADFKIRGRKVPFYYVYTRRGR